MVLGLQAILKDTADYVQWNLEEGEVTTEASRELLTQLSTGDAGQPAAAGGPVPSAAAAVPPTSARPTKQDEGVAPPRLQELAAEMAQCTRCRLHAERTQVVPGQGNPNPDILFVGEAPGKDEDEQGLAFVGRAGKLLTKMIEAMGFTRDEVFIANINKCRPPDNRKPTREEMDACLPFLRQQVALLQPQVIVAMGATAVDGLVPLPKDATISKIRGTWMTFEGIPLMPTFHPAYLLRNPAMKRPVWDDLKTVLHHLGRTAPPAQA